MTQPSTGWQEKVAPDEAERFARYAASFAELQRRKSERFGPGRALHRKQVLGVAGRLEVRDGLPGHARHGLFATPGVHDAWVRLSNGGADRAPDRRPDVRGFAIKVLGVRGPGALGGETACQDFLLINHPAFAFPRSDEFVELVLAAGKGGGALLAHVFRRYGPIGGAKFLARFTASIGRPFSGFASERFFSAAPIACGPYAARVRMLPAASPAPGSGGDWTADFLGQLSAADLSFDLQLQFFTDERVTPIEDASVDWPESEAPYLTVARLVLPRGGGGLLDGTLQERIESAIFDPWSALADHRPLGDVMRARKVVYFESEKGRGAVPG
ncbi:MAG: catalase [Deltaproteobacteria bacterium]